jgi:hypothetical protein
VPGATRAPVTIGFEGQDQPSVFHPNLDGVDYLALPGPGPIGCVANHEERSRCQRPVFKGLGACLGTLRGIGYNKVGSRLCRDPDALKNYV